MSVLSGTLGWLDDRTGASRLLHAGMRKVFPDHWSFLLGEIALFCFIILVATGIFLTLFYVPSADTLRYTGPYQPLLGADVSAAFDSVMNISFEVRAGLVIRQIHHWAAIVFVAAVVVHMSRIFLTAAFRKPRELNWVIGAGLLLLSLAAGFTGYSLPDDLLSGTGLRVGYSVLLSVPILGPTLSFLAFGGEYPTDQIISRLFVIHVLILPALIIGAVTLHVGLVFLQKHTIYRTPGAREDLVRGSSFWPVQVFRSSGLFFLTTAVLALLGGLVQINPVWDYGPYDATVATAGAQPDWYMGWLEGAMRLAPPFEPTILGVTIPAPFLPAIVLPGLMFLLFASWPFIEGFVRDDHTEHHILEWPSEAPGRTAAGAALATFLGVLTIAGGNDVLARLMSIRLADLNLMLQLLLVTLPIVVGLITYRLMRARGRRHKDQPAVTELVRTPAGGYEERRRP